MSDIEEFLKVLKEESLLFQKKSADYGELPFKETGVIGLAVRILDKIHRVLNTSRDGFVITITDENLEDTLMDIANYANIAIVKLRQKDTNKKTMRTVADILEHCNIK